MDVSIRGVFSSLTGGLSLGGLVEAEKNKPMLAPIYRIYSDKLKSKPHKPTIWDADADSQIPQFRRFKVVMKIE